MVPGAEANSISVSSCFASSLVQNLAITDIRARIREGLFGKMTPAGETRFAVTTLAGSDACLVF